MNASTFCIYVLGFNFLTTSLSLLLLLFLLLSEYVGHIFKQLNDSKFTLHKVFVNWHCLRFVFHYQSFSFCCLSMALEKIHKKGACMHTTEVFRFDVKSNSKLMQIPIFLNWFGELCCEFLHDWVFSGQLFRFTRICSNVCKVFTSFTVH